ncbi:hypothetical protein BSKO_01571 [Bryopsis sp. KO-2023]|nr:hypothetical protein BSKO_01571 [Bryopsis sp. KO-2023]
MEDDVSSRGIDREGLEDSSREMGGGEDAEVGPSKSVTKELIGEGRESGVERAVNIEEKETAGGGSDRRGVAPSLGGTTSLTLEKGGVDAKRAAKDKSNAGDVNKTGSGLVGKVKSLSGNSGKLAVGEGCDGQGVVGGSFREGDANLDVEMGVLNLEGEVLKDGCESLLSQPIARALSCSICQGILLDAYKCLECMHSYCYTCVRPRVEIGDPRNVCPVEKCGRHDIDGFTPTYLGPNPFDPVKPKLLPDSLLSGIVKKVFGFGSCPPSPDDTDGTDEMEFEKADKEPSGVGLTDSKGDLAGMGTPCSLTGGVETDNQNWNCDTHPFVSGPDPGASAVKVPRKRSAKGTSDRKPRKTAPKAKPGAGGSHATLPKGSTSAKRKRGSKLALSPTKKLQATAQSLVELALFPVDALDKSQALPALQCNYFKMPGTVLVEFLLRFIREELQSPRLVLFCRDRLLMPDAKKSLEWVKKEVWTPMDEHHDIFTLYYSDHTSLPDGHWLRGN